jgi:RNA polymerase sigma-70 factor (ECF subfamily)
VAHAEGAGPSARLVPTSANGQLAVGAYCLEAGRYVPIALDVLTLEEARITGITAFRAPALFPRFGLPAELLAPH